MSEAQILTKPSLKVNERDGGIVHRSLLWDIK